jgi:hypothetical protein
MKRLKKGPELKMPELRVPDFLANLFYDLRDRRLLPLVLLVVVAIAAVPFLLGNHQEEAFEPAPGGGIIGTLESAPEGSSKLTVVEARPGLRDYRKRLRGDHSVDPFKQRYTSPVLKGAKLNEEKGGGGKGEGKGSKSGGEKTSTSTTNATPKGGGSPPHHASGQPTPAAPPPGGSGSPGGSGLTFFSFAIDVKIVKSTGGEADPPIVRDKVLPQTPLPSKGTPVVTYMGPARDKGGKANGKVLLLVSDQVREIEGDATCLSGEEVCQLLEVEPGFPEIFRYGEAGVQYTINVLKLSLVVTGHS